MLKLNCELSSQKETRDVEVVVSLTYRMKVGGSDKKDMEESIKEFVDDHVIPSDFDPDKIEMNIEWV